MNIEDGSLGLDEKESRCKPISTKKRKQVRDSYASIQMEFRP